MGTSCVLGTMWPTCSECRCSACRPGPWSSPWHRCHSSSLPWRKRHPLAPHHPCSKWCSATRSWNTQDYFKSCLNDWNTADMVKMLINQSISQSITKFKIRVHNHNQCLLQCIVTNKASPPLLSTQSLYTPFWSSGANVHWPRGSWHVHRKHVYPHLQLTLK